MFCFVFWIFSPLDWLVYRLISCKFAIFSVWQFIIFGAFLSYYVCLKCNKNSEKPPYIPWLAKKHRSEKGQSCWLESVSGLLFHLITVLKSNLILVTCKTPEICYLYLFSSRMESNGLELQSKVYGHQIHQRIKNWTSLFLLRSSLKTLY